MIVMNIYGHRRATGNSASFAAMLPRLTDSSPPRGCRLASILSIRRLPAGWRLAGLLFVRASGHDGALTGFVVALLRRILARVDAAAPVVWCPAAATGGSGMLYAAGLAALGLDPGRLLIVDPQPWGTAGGA